jgi:hypothetical protein
MDLSVAGACVAGETDVTVLFKAAPGSRRWQHGTSLAGEGDSGYTVILGSHRNRCLKIERDGQTCAQVRSWLLCLAVAWP